MVKRIVPGQSSPRLLREPPRVRCCLPLWKIVLIVPFLLILPILIVLLRFDFATLQESHSNNNHHHHTIFATPDHFDHIEQKNSIKHVRDNISPTQQIPPPSMPTLSKSQDTTTTQSNTAFSSSQPKHTPITLTTTTTSNYLSNLKELEKAFNAASCQRRRRYDQNQLPLLGKDEYVLNQDFCSEMSTINNYYYYNSLPFERMVCGAVIPPNSYITSTQKCSSPPRLFAQIPNRTGNMKPVHLSFRSSSSNKSARPFPCDVPCHSSDGGGVVQTRFVTPIDNSEPWKISFSMEGPLYYHQLAIREDAYKNHHYYSTTSYESEIPLPYFSWAEYDIHSPQPVNFDTAIKGASFMAKNCASRNNREAVVKELSQYFRVDALSLCLHNAKPPPGANLRDKIQTMRFYLFHLAFENQCYPDYITEKLWGPMQSGTIPVYFGSPNVKDHAPNNSLILVDDFPTVQQLGAYLHQVANNRTLFEFHQQWRKEPLPPHFHARYDFTEIHSTCRTCRWAYSKFYGLGWNHKNQSLRELEMPRYPCVNGTGQIIEPFVEQWSSSGANLDDSTLSLSYSGPSQRTCYEQESEDLMRNDLVIDGALRRVVWQQDGVIDMLIEALQSSTTSIAPRLLQIRIPWIKTTTVDIQMKQIEEGHIRVQNDKTRFTLLTLPKRKVDLGQSDGESILQIWFDESSHLPLKLRVIVEDVETLRKGADQDENFFGNLMKRDFYNPVEVFST